MFKKFLMVFIFFLCTFCFAEEFVIQSSVVVLQDSSDNQVKLIGTPHFGKPKYWELVKEELIGYEIVLHENLTGFPRLMTQYYICAQLLNCIYEPSIMPYGQSGWIMVDISTAEMNEILNGLLEYGYNHDAETLAALQILCEGNIFQKIILINKIMRMYNESTSQPQNHDPVVMMRIPVQLEAILEHRNCAVITGETHILLLIEALKANGYTIVEQRKLHPFF